MKKNFWNKHMNDYTGKDMVKWIAAFYAVFIAIYASIYAIIIFWGRIASWVGERIDFIKDKFSKNDRWAYGEEDEELD